jgi:predicted DsbA family dithiol-disulfide isomerase
MKQEFELNVDWIGVEIHPETPPQGRPLTELFPPADIDRMMEHLRGMGAPFGITFTDRPLLSNSKAALIAAEFSREQGRFQQVHESIFSSYFSHGLDIGDLDVLADILRNAGLDGDAFKSAVAKGTYLPRLAQAQQEATLAGVTGVPVFIIDGTRRLIGAQPLDVFRKTLRTR